MSRTTTFENELFAWVFHKTNPSWLNNASWYLSLHYADLGEDGVQTTSEVAYTGYSRLAIVRSSLGWSVSGGVVVNVGEVLFPECTAGSVTATHAALGTAASGAGQVLFHGPLSSALPISAGQTPSFAAGSLSIFDE